MFNEYVKPTELQRDAQENIRVAQEKMKKNYDKHRCRAQNYNLGDVMVVRRLPEQTLLPNSKTQAKYRGPLTIIKVLPSDTYQVTDLRTAGEGRKRQPNYTTTVHASQLKLFHLITEDEDLSDGDCEDLITSYCNDDSDENSCIENTRPTRVRRTPHHLKDYKLY
ncbi:hypothetical protein HNY73_019679 [Argiope bruennichi]|uniref:Uncharacterized protein n=1 Tax=Argiope bruennichi TaxID=94029 RepID=A0A8T0E4C5_ARGBR|nr:hypothetical protein HNY73_019679 [Argiope bruennichi]